MANTSRASYRSISPIDDGHELQELQAQGSAPSLPSPQSMTDSVVTAASRSSSVNIASQPFQPGALSRSSLQDQQSGGPPVSSSPPAVVTTPAVTSSGTATSSPAPIYAQTTSWQRIRRLWYHAWVAEICSCTLAALSLLAIAMILYTQQDTLKSQWPLRITINAAISVFVVLLKAGVALPISEGISQLKWQWFSERPHNLVDMEDFDSASRDAWSSFLFIFKFDHDGTISSWRRPFEKLLSTFRWQRRNFRRYFAKFAAFLAVLAFITDPFTQQIVEYESCTHASPSSQAAISRTNAYIATGGQFTQYDFVIDGPMSVAINRGMIDPPANPATLTATHCPSGNCIFGSFSSIGMCHLCQDISDQVQNQTTRDTSGAVATNFTISHPGLSNNSLNLGGPLMIDGTPSYRLLQTSLDSTQGTYLPISLVVLMSTSLYEAGPAIPSALAFNCSMTPFVKSYNASMTSSSLSEDLLSQESIGLNQLNLKPLASHPSDNAYLLATNSVWRNGRLETCTAGKANSTGFTRIATSNIGASPNNPSNFDGDYSRVETQWLPTDCIWTFGHHALAVMAGEMVRTLDGLQLTQPLIQPLQFPYRQPLVAAGQMAAKNIWRNGTTNLAAMNDFMAGLTDSMTATIRRNGKGGASEWATGVEAANTTCVHVRWAWFSYPTTLVTLAIVFLIVLIGQSSDAVATRAWKSSSLAVLFCAVDDPIRVQTGFDQTRADLSDLAKGVKTQLIADGEGRARFV